MIGAGFFGCEIALELHRMGFERIVVFERAAGIMRRASYVNQARIHNGYHYPRAMLTAEQSRRNFERFLAEYSDAVFFGMEKAYAVALGSCVSASQFERFCTAIRAPCVPARHSLGRLFDAAMIEEVFETREFTFDANVIADRLLAALESSRIELRLETPVTLGKVSDSHIVLETKDGPIQAQQVINATYANLDRFGSRLQAGLKKELAEIVLVEPPPELAPFGITVIDGPYFSIMPFPAARLHSLTHVRYTPHEAWSDDLPEDIRPSGSNAQAMIRDAARYVPSIAKSRVQRSLFDVKTVLAQSETNDDRPILIERSLESPRIISILGAKIDNIFDARAYLRTCNWDL